MKLTERNRNIKRERRTEIRDKKREREVLDVWVDTGHGGNRQKGLNER